MGGQSRCYKFIETRVKQSSIQKQIGICIYTLKLLDIHLGICQTTSSSSSMMLVFEFLSLSQDKLDDALGIISVMVKRISVRKAQRVSIYLSLCVTATPLGYNGMRERERGLLYDMPLLIVADVSW